MTILIMIAGTLLVSLLMAISLLLKGYVLSVLWSWFIVPIFGLPVLSLPVAIGICIIIGMFIDNNKDNEAKTVDDDKKTEEIFKSILRFLAPLAALFTGWVVQGFM